MRKTIDKLATNILRFLPAFLIFVIPLFFLPLTPDFFQINKQYLLFITSSIALVFFCFRLVTRGQIQITLSPALLPLAGFTLVTLLSSLIQHPNPRFALMNTTAITISVFIIYLATTSTQKTSVVIKSIILGMIMSLVILSFFSILVQFGVIAQIPAPEWLKAKLFHPAGSPYHFLTLAIPTLIATIGFGVSTRNWLLKPLILAGAILIATGSIFSFKVILPSDTDRPFILLPYSAGWSIAVDTLKNPKTAILGAGPDTYTNVFNKLKPASLNLDNNLWTLRFSNSSSELLTLLTTSGILGVILFSIAYIKTIKSLLKINFKSDPETLFILTGLFSILVLFALFPANTSTHVLGIVFLIAAAIKLKTEGSNSVKDVQFGIFSKQITSAYSEISPKEKPSLPILPWLLTLASFVLLGVFWSYASRIYSSNIVIFQAAKNVKDNPVMSYNKQIEAAKIDPSDPYLKINLSQTYLSVTKQLLTTKDGQEITPENKQKALEFANQALNEAKAATTLAPYDVTAWENFATVSRFLATYNVEGAIDWTLATYTQAITLDPSNPMLRAQLGTFYIQINNPNQAIRFLEQAIELKPNWNAPYYNLSLVYKANKDYAKALAYVKEAKKYTALDSKDIEQLDKEIAELEKLVPKEPAPTPTPTPAN